MSAAVLLQELPPTHSAFIWTLWTELKGTMWDILSKILLNICHTKFCKSVTWSQLSSFCLLIVKVYATRFNIDCSLETMSVLNHTIKFKLSHSFFFFLSFTLFIYFIFGGLVYLLFSNLPTKNSRLQRQRGQRTKQKRDRGERGGGREGEKENWASETQSESELMTRTFCKNKTVCDTKCYLFSISSGSKNEIWHLCSPL